MKIENYFETVSEALNAAYARAIEEKAEFDLPEWEGFTHMFNGIEYGETRRNACLLFKYRGRLNYSKALTVIIYRLETGRYELTSYIN
jgi:hypothetical protein